MKKISIAFLATTLSIQLASAQWTNGTNISNTNAGNVGIGTTNLYTPLTVESGSAAGINAGLAINSSHAYGSGQGTAGGAIVFSRNRTTDVSGIKIEAQIAGGNYTETTSQGGFLGLYTSNASNNLIEALHIDPRQRVGIGTSAPQNALDVNGTIHSKQVNVDLTGWPDYVFKYNYRLIPLNQVKAYIDKNQRLPDMPSENDVIKNGINLGDMVKLQTQKIEELTLYLIEQEKKNGELAAQLKSQQEQINKLAMALSDKKQKSSNLSHDKTKHHNGSTKLAVINVTKAR